MKKGVTFETKCWQRDWEVLLKTDYLKAMIDNCDYQFQTKRLIINNVDDIKEVSIYADKAIQKGIIDEYVIAEDYSKQTLECAHLTKEELGKGYYYSIAELVGIYVCDTDFLLHFSSDTRMEKKFRDNFIKDGLNLFEKMPKLAEVTPMWNYKYKEIPSPNWDESKTFHIGNGFSDQCYLIRTTDFRGDVYHYQHETGKNYPEYGGELFEKRCNAYLRQTGRVRAVHMKSSYWSSNIYSVDQYNKEQRLLNKLIHKLKYKL